MIPGRLVFAAPGKDGRRKVRLNERVSRPVRLRAERKRRRLVCRKSFFIFFSLSLAMKSEGGCEEQP